MDFLFKASRPTKRIISLFSDLCFVSVAFWTAMLVRLDTTSIFFHTPSWILLAFLVPITLIANVKLGLYRAVLRYINSKAAVSIALSVCFTTVALVFLSFFLNIDLPRTVPVIFSAFLLVLVGGSRFLMRTFIASSPIKNKHKEKVIIYGAGSAGRQLAQSLLHGDEYYPVAFIDDDVRIHKRIIQGITVYRRNDLSRLIEDSSVSRLLLAMPRENKKRIARVLSKIEALPVEILSIPGSADLVSGKARIDELREVSIEDLLGRDPVKPDQCLLKANTYEKIVMVTGAGGSIGSELCRQILKQKPTKLILFELSEFALYQINGELQKQADELGYDCQVVPLLGSVQRKNRMMTVMRTFKVQTVYHAAAYKHVPVVEHNVVEGVRNNVFGTLYAAEAAMEAKVETFVLISTDKAVRPTNVMGTTKRMAELILQALARKESNTRYCMVRFGNVLGSSGSVVPLFRDQIKCGGPITVTHPDIIRYFMTIPEAAQLVIQAGAMGTGGDVFVLDMGDPVKISDLAVKMIHLSGMNVKDKLNPDGDIEIKYTGLRQGEKLFEELLIGDDVTQTDHRRIMSAHETLLTWEALEKLLIRLDDACHNFSHEAIRRILLEAPTGFVPKDGICDLVWQAKAKAKA
ncbi:nucleoside-diphosphate sugar epimerase/dehydratase [Colwellia sp. Bg11-28]|uniref:nucleoside-diphosphate sugar epimerase/dehydratase n=1 Tax=Colwellia sp. Bg11-28 TaxID=2058305 RepID=UPI000C34BE48|nr:nucleoside-diphosphate sugar epimerase/dehydratase [Colwellia sp. Bg11-28]PKH87987.1 nucleoside-diphosphate sugar epimerase [Colwellia sp. Bg11-28]